MSAQQQGVPAVGFLVMVLTPKKVRRPDAGRDEASEKAGEVLLEDAAVIRQDAQGKVHYHETGTDTGKGAGIGALVGGIVGVLGGPVGVALGAGVGAAVGAAASGDKGFRNESLGTVGVACSRNLSAIAAITSHDFLRAVQKQVPMIDTACWPSASPPNWRRGSGKQECGHRILC